MNDFDAAIALSVKARAKAHMTNPLTRRTIEIFITRLSTPDSYTIEICNKHGKPILNFVRVMTHAEIENLLVRFHFDGVHVHWLPCE